MKSCQGSCRPPPRLMGEFGFCVTERDTCKQLGFDLDGTYGYRGRDLVSNLQALGISCAIYHWLLCFSIQLHAESLLCDNVGYHALLDASWVINLSFDAQFRDWGGRGHNLPSCLVLSSLDTLKIATNSSVAVIGWWKEGAARNMLILNTLNLE